MYISGVVIVLIVVCVLAWVGNAKRRVALDLVGNVQFVENEVSQLVQSLCVEAARYAALLRRHGLEPPADPALIVFAEQRLRRINAITGLQVDLSESDSVLDLVRTNWFESDEEFERWVGASNPAPKERNMRLQEPRPAPGRYEQLAEGQAKRPTLVPRGPEGKAVREGKARQAYASAVRLHKAGRIDECLRAFHQVHLDYPYTFAGDLALREMKAVARSQCHPGHSVVVRRRHGINTETRVHGHDNQVKTPQSRRCIRRDVLRWAAGVES